MYGFYENRLLTPKNGINNRLNTNKYTISYGIGNIPKGCFKDYIHI